MRCPAGAPTRDVQVAYQVDDVSEAACYFARMRRRLFIVLLWLPAVVLAAILLPIGVIFTYWAWDDYRFPRRSPLAADLPNAFVEASTAFDARVREKFPVGSPESELVRVLSEQGFTSDRKYPVYGRDAGVRSGPAPKVLQLTHSVIVCQYVWNVCLASGRCRADRRCVGRVSRRLPVGVIETAYRLAMISRGTKF